MFDILLVTNQKCLEKRVWLIGGTQKRKLPEFLDSPKAQKQLALFSPYWGIKT